MESFEVVMQVVLFPMIFLSGAMFPLNALPGWLTVLTRIDPLTYAVQPLRQVVFAAPDMPPAARARFPVGASIAGLDLPLGGQVDVVVVVVFATVFLVLAVRGLGRGLTGAARVPAVPARPSARGTSPCESCAVRRCDRSTSTARRRPGPRTVVFASRFGGGAGVCRVAAVGLLALALAGCGGGSTAGTPRTTERTTTSAIRVTLTAPTHHPRVGAPWTYVVTIRDSEGRRLRARVHLQVLFNGVPVGQIGVHRVVGVWRETINWPAESAGHPLVFQAVVTASGTTVTRDYPLTVTR